MVWKQLSAENILVLVFMEKQDKGNRLELQPGTFRLDIRNNFIYLQDTRLPGDFEHKSE